jgi:hypothetical protein
MLFSADPPGFIRLLADAIEWTLPLKVASGVFLGQLAKNMADDLWKNKVDVAKAMGSAAAFPIRKLVGAFEKAWKISRKSTTFAVGVPVSDDDFGATVTVPMNSTEDSAVTLAIFVHHAQEIEHTLRQHLSAGQKIVGPVQVRPEPGGSVLLVWMDRDSVSTVEVRLPFTLVEDATSPPRNPDPPPGGAGA